MRTVWGASEGVTDAHPSAPRPDNSQYQLPAAYKHLTRPNHRSTGYPRTYTVRQYSVVTSSSSPRETRDRCAVSLTERGVLTSCYTYSCRIRVRVTKVSICIYPISISASLSLLTHIHTDTRSPTRATATSLPLKCTRTHTCRSMRPAQVRTVSLSRL